MKKFVILLLAAVSLVGCVSEPKTVSYYKEHAQERKDRLSWCKEYGISEGESVESRDCTAARTARQELAQALTTEIRTLRNGIIKAEFESLKRTKGKGLDAEYMAMRERVSEQIRDLSAQLENI